MSRAVRTGIAGLLLAAGVRAALGQAAGGTVEPSVLTLDGALSIALESNRRLASAELEVGRAADRLGAVKAQRLPTLSVDATAARTLNTVEFEVSKGALGTYPGVGPIPGGDTRIESDPRWTVIGLANVAQPLSQLYKIGLGVKASEQQMEIAKEELRGRRQSLALQVRKTYYAIVSAEGSLAAARESLSLSQEVLRVVSSRVVEKAALAADEVDARATAAQAAYQVALLETVISSSRAQLNVLLARDPGTPFRVAALPEPKPVAEAESEAAERASVRHSDTRKAKLLVDVAAKDVALAKAEFVPDLSLTMNYFKPYQVEFQPKGIWSAGLLLQWKIFDGGKRSKELAEKKKVEEQARLAAADTEASARAEAGQNWRRVRDAEALLVAARLARDASRDRLRVARVRYEERYALAQDLRRAQADLAEADHRCNEAVVSYWSARADYDVSIGEDL